ncbi:MAG: DUF4261 domain-containing protein [Planctomycetaceae bacterium]|nr:DUF4261 domain-containing protein [Planctomycetaceae bacterium]
MSDNLLPPSDHTSQLAFVLLSSPQPPDAEAIAAALQELEPNLPIQIAEDETDKTEEGDVVFLDLDQELRAMIALMPVPVPNGEADEGVEFSLAALGSDWKAAPHEAHYVVGLIGFDELNPLDRMMLFTSLLAAVVKSSNATGVYWGNAGATHPAEFFLSVASDNSPHSRVLLWNGLSIAREDETTLSLLSLGMRQLDLPDLLMVVPEHSHDDPIGMMFDLLCYIIDRGEAIPAGETVGRSEDQKLTVEYVPSPIEGDPEVWRVDLTS